MRKNILLMKRSEVILMTAKIYVVHDTSPIDKIIVSTEYYIIT
jgi:hypothetical protein